MNILNRLGFNKGFQSVQFTEDGKYIQLFAIENVGVCAIQAKKDSLVFFADDDLAKKPFYKISYTQKDHLAFQLASIQIRQSLHVYPSYTVVIEDIAGFQKFIVANRMNYHKSGLTPNLVPYSPLGNWEEHSLVNETIKPLNLASLDISFGIFTHETARRVLDFYKSCLPQ